MIELVTFIRVHLNLSGRQVSPSYNNIQPH